MDSSEQFINSATDAEIEEIAAFIVSVFRKPIEILGAGKDLRPILAILVRAAEDPEGLKKDLISEMHKRSPDEVNSDLAFALDMMRSPRKTFGAVLDETFAPGTRGKRPKITASKEEQMVRMARSLLPSVRALIALRVGSSRRTVAESVRYLEADFPIESQLLLRQVEVLENFSPLAVNPKVPRSKLGNSCAKSLVRSSEYLHPTRRDGLGQPFENENPTN